MPVPEQLDLSSGRGLAWRQLVAVRNGAGLRAHMLMIGVAATLFAPLLASGVAWRGAEASPSLAPIGLGVTLGALLFGDPIPYSVALPLRDDVIQPSARRFRG